MNTSGRCPDCGEPTQAGQECQYCLLRIGLADPQTATQALAPFPGLAGVAPSVGDRIDRYCLLKILGEGGMGIVYLAEQEQPIRRQVALKIMKPGVASPESVMRFEGERQALAIMEHPNIAHVYGAGATDAGQPYFVMEYVPGPPITAYCDSHTLSNRDRLKLFRQVCLGIHHAHQKGVIHRDIKPSNVLVTEKDGVPVPKVIDFGIAKAMDRQQAGMTLFTQRGVLVGTPEYMSPEQAGLQSPDVDAGSDVYSLGVLLYELLVGVLPFDHKELGKKGFLEILRLIREEEPVPLSGRLKMLVTASEIARQRDTTPGTLRRQLSGELEWITMRAMEKDRRRRYSSAAEFGADVERYLDNEPVLASPPSRVYRLKKFVSRHRWPVAAASVVLMTLCAGLLTSTSLYFRAERERREAEQQRETAHQRQLEAIVERSEAERQRTRAEDESSKAKAAAETARKQEREALWESYVANIGAADEHIRAGELKAAQQRLIQCDPSLRGWEWRHLWSRSDRSIATLHPSNQTRAIGFSRDGQNILFADEGHVEVWSASTFAPVRAYSIDSNDKLLAMSADGSQVAVLDQSGFSILDPTSGQVMSKPKDYPRQGSPKDSLQPAVAFSPDASMVGAAFGDRTILVWNTASGDRIAGFHGPVGPTGQTGALSFSRDGKKIAAGSGSGELRVWETRSSRIVGNAPGDGTPVRSIAFSPDGRQIAWGSNNSLQILDLDSEKVTLNLPMPSVASVAFAPHDKLLLINRMDGWTELRDPRSGIRLETLSDRTPGEVESGLTNIVRAAFNPEGTMIVTTTRPGKLDVFDARQQVAPSLPIPVAALNSVPPLGASLENIAAVVGGNIQVWQAQSGFQVKEWHGETGRSRPPVRFSPDGSLLATGYNGNRLAVWSIATDTLVNVFTGHTTEVHLVEFSQDRSRVATAAADKTVRVWEIRSGRELATIHKSAQHIALSPDGTLLAVVPDSAAASAVEIYDARSGRLRFVVRIGAGVEPGISEYRTRAIPLPPQRPPAILAVAFRPDGKEIAIADDVGIWIKEVNSDASPIRLEHVSAGGTLAIKFTPDSVRLAAVRSDGTITIWAAGTDGPLLILRGCGAMPAAFDFRMGGVVCVGSDGSVHTWGVSSKHYPGAKKLVDSPFRRLSSLRNVGPAGRNDACNLLTRICQ